MSYNIDVYASSTALTDEDVRKKIVVLIDVLRASTTILTALDNGAKEVVPVADMSEASLIAQRLDADQFLLCGERDGKPIDGYHLGNSPLEYTSDLVSNKTIILNTTNGTKTISKTLSADQIVVASLNNLDAVVDYLRDYSEKEIVIACSGWKSRIAFEDLICAGLIVKRLFNNTFPEVLKDGAKVAYVLAEKYEDEIENVIQWSNHADRLRSLGFEDDIHYCSQLNSTTSVPILTEGMIRIKDGSKKSISKKEE